MDVREYLYVDDLRVRSLLAQLTDGLPDEKAASTSRVRKLRAGLKAIEVGSESGTSSSLRLSLADLHVSMLEEAAESTGLLTDVSKYLTKEKFWLRGQLRNSLEPGMILRLTAPTLIVNPTGIGSVLRGFNAAIDQDDEMDQIIDMIEAMYQGAVAVSIRPTEPESARAAFVAAVPTSAFDLTPADLLANRVGPDPIRLTTVFQVSRVPTERESAGSSAAQFSDMFDRVIDTSGDRLDREVFDSAISKLAGMLEQWGLAAAPRWPAVAVVPLAIYRNVMPMALDESEIDAIEHEDESEEV